MSRHIGNCKPLRRRVVYMILKYFYVRCLALKIRHLARILQPFCIAICRVTFRSWLVLAAVVAASSG